MPYPADGRTLAAGVVARGSLPARWGQAGGDAYSAAVRYLRSRDDAPFEPGREVGDGPGVEVAPVVHLETVSVHRIRLAAGSGEAIHAHEAALYERARKGVASINGLRILGEAEGKGAILSFTLEGAHAHDIAQLLDRYGVAVRAGTHCAEPLMRRLGVSSSVRASFALYNTTQEVDAFLEALDRTRTFFA